MINRQERERMKRTWLALSIIASMHRRWPEREFYIFELDGMIHVITK